MRLFYNPDLDIGTWEYFLYFQATNLFFLLYNIFGLRRTRWIHDVGCKSYTPNLHSCEILIRVQQSSFLSVPL